MNQIKQKLDTNTAIKTQVYTLDLIEYLSCNNKGLL